MSFQKFSTQLKYFRKQKRISQSELAKMIECKRNPYICTIEKETRLPPELSVVKKIINALDIPENKQYEFIAAAARERENEKAKEYREALLELSPKMEDIEKLRLIATKTFKNLYNIKTETAELLSDPLHLDILNALGDLPESLKITLHDLLLFQKELYD